MLRGKFVSVHAQELCKALVPFGFFGLAPESRDLTVAPVILAVSGGSMTYWFFYSLIFSRIRKNFKLSTLLWIGRISGAIIMIIGIALASDGLMKLIFE